MSELTRADYLRIKWSFFALVLSIVIAGGLFAGLKAFDERATADLRKVRSNFDEAQVKVDQIAQEEASIRANIVQYRQIDGAGQIRGEDRLQMNEYFALVRSQHALFPISLEISEQKSLPIQYGELDGKNVDEPGRPISLQVSEVKFSLPLLHENDLVKLLNYILSQPELLQIKSCSIAATGGAEPNYLRLNQHFNAACAMEWYTFHIDELASGSNLNE